MCGICGCGQIEQKHNHTHGSHTHSHDHSDLGEERLIQVEQALLSKNNSYAEQNRAYFQAHHIFTLNLVSSPGAGKTTLLVETIKQLKNAFPIAVIEGDRPTN
jgi:hydrogenase nickel incorporation protein HypB